MRARDIGLPPGVLPPGPLNAITDIAGVAVGHVTLFEGAAIRTGVTAILPHGGNIFQEKVPAGIAVGNGYGKFAGATQIIELGEIETPIVLTNTLSVAEGIAGCVEWTLAQPGNERVTSVNAVVGETNDGYLNDIRGRHVTVAHVREAIERAMSGSVAEGCVGAGTGTQAFGWKGGIGTSSRLVSAGGGHWRVGALVQTNYGGRLSITDATPPSRGGGDGSVVIVLATDAPVSDRNLRRIAQRAFVGIARTGSWMANGSGDYAVAFSTAPGVRRDPSRRRAIATAEGAAAEGATAADATAEDATAEDLANDVISPLFQAAAEATEEAVYNAMLQAVPVTGIDGHCLEALPPMAIRTVPDCAGGSVRLMFRS